MFGFDAILGTLFQAILQFVQPDLLAMLTDLLGGLLPIA